MDLMSRDNLNQILEKNFQKIENKLKISNSKDENIGLSKMCVFHYERTYY